MNSSHNSGQPSAIKGGSSAVATPANSGSSLFGSVKGAQTSASTSDRRSSEEQKFSNLQSVKRGSQDYGQRRGSINDQKPAPGFLASTFNNLTGRS